MQNRRGHIELELIWDYLRITISSFKCGLSSSRCILFREHTILLEFRYAEVQLSFVRKIIAITNIPTAIHSTKPVATIGADNAVRIHPTDGKTSAISKDASKIVFIPHRLALHFGGCDWFSIAVRLFNI